MSGCVSSQARGEIVEYPDSGKVGAGVADPTSPVGFRRIGMFRARSGTLDYWESGDLAPPLRNRWFADSPLEGAVTSEPVSEAGNSLLAGKIQGISLDFAARHASIAAKEQ